MEAMQKEEEVKDDMETVSVEEPVAELEVAVSDE